MNKNRAELIRACDRLWSRLVAHGMNGRCIICSMPGDDSHHWKYCRSILAFRWTLENGVYCCRVHHNEFEQDNTPLCLKIKKDYPHLWNWYLNQPPLVSRPISTSSIAHRLTELQDIAKTLGLNMSKQTSREFPEFNEVWGPALRVKLKTPYFVGVEIKGDKELPGVIFLGDSHVQ